MTPACAGKELNKGKSAPKRPKRREMREAIAPGLSYGEGAGSRPQTQGSCFEVCASRGEIPGVGVVGFSV